MENGEWKVFTNQPKGKPFVIFALNEKSIWAAYSDVYHNSTLYYFDGKNWILQPQILANVIYGMNFLNEDFGLLIGFEEAVLKRKNKWERLPPVSPFKENSFFIAEDSTIWLHEYDTSLVKFDGLKWKNIAPDKKINLVFCGGKKIFCLTDTIVYEIINDALSFHSSYGELKKINSISVLDGERMFACGKNGLILSYKNKKWKCEKSPVKVNLAKIKMVSQNEGWCVGKDGTILQYGLTAEPFADAWKGFGSKKFYGESKVVDDEYAVIVADFNNDGLPDIFSCGLFENNHLYINKDLNLFVDEATERQINGKDNYEAIPRNLKLGACAADFDNDGTIDLYVTRLNKKNSYYRNLGDGFFTDYSEFSGGLGKENDRSNSAIAGDVDNDGDLDLFVANENTTNRLFENNGAGKFTEITEKANLLTVSGGTGSSFGDIDGDGDLDLFVTNWAAENKLFKNLFVETGKLRFVDFSDSANIFDKEYTKSNAVVFADIDNDADLDLFITNRKFSNRLYVNNGRGIFKDRTKELIGEDSLLSYGAVIADFNGDGKKDIFLSNVGETVFYLQENGKFVERTLKYGAMIDGYGTGVANLDFDNDGDIDIYYANYIGSGSRFLENKSANNNFLKISVTGTKNNRSGIGAKVFVFETNHLNDISHLIFYSEISGGSGYVSMNETVQTVPVDNRVSVDVKVIFPDGTEREHLSVPANSNLIVTDISGFEAVWAKMSQSFVRLFLDEHRFLQLLKWILIFLIIGISSLRGIKKYNWSRYFVLGQIISLFFIYAILSSHYEYKSFYLATLLPVSTIIIALLVLHLFFELVILKNESMLERERIRTKLARDLHDDLASTLGSAGIYLELLKNSANEKDGYSKEFMEKVESLISNSKQSITDLIWTIKPTPEFISNFSSRIKENYSEVLRAKNIKLNVVVSQKDESIKLDAVVKHNVFLIFKEAINNIIKHSAAKNAEIKIWKDETGLNFSIKDDGKGFDVEKSMNKSNGLKNMKLRIEEIGGSLEILSGESGTNILLHTK